MAEPVQPAARKQVVLVVDDEASICRSLRRLFERAWGDVAVLTAASGAEALELLEREPVDVILSDYRMPGLNGLEFLARAHQARPDVANLMMTAFPDQDAAIQSVNEAHVLKFLLKPWDTAQLLAAVRDILDDRQRVAERQQAFAHALHAARTGASAPVE